MPNEKTFKPGKGYVRPTLSKSEMSTVKKEVSKNKPVAVKQPSKPKSTSSFADRAAAVDKANKSKGITNISTKAPSTTPAVVRDMQLKTKRANELGIKPKEGMGVIEYIAPTGVGSSAVSVARGLSSRPVVQATKAALDTPLPLGNAVTKATAGALTPSNIVATSLKAMSIKNLADPNSKTWKAVKEAKKNPNMDNIVKAATYGAIDVAGAFGIKGPKTGVAKATKYGSKTFKVAGPDIAKYSPKFIKAATLLKNIKK